MSEPACDLEPLCPHGRPPAELCGQCPDPCVVDSAPVAHIIAAFVESWLNERPSRGGRRGRPVGDEPVAGDVDPIAPYTYLAVETGLAAGYACAEGRSWVDAAGRNVGVVSAADIARAEDDIRRARNAKRNPSVELRVADAVIACIGEPGMFDDLTIRPNPKAPAERHGECCGGSLTGSGR